MIICLIGFMGCGKSSVGRKLSQLLCCPFMDLDDVIEASAGRSIAEIFATDGEAAFRQMELDTLADIMMPEIRDRKQSLPSQAMGPSLCGQRGSTASDPLFPAHTDFSSFSRTDNSDTAGSAASQQGTTVLALGGGTVMTPECAEIVRNHAHCIYLKASVETLVEHLEGEVDKRPMLAQYHSDEDKVSALRSRIEELMAKRSATYESVAHTVINTDGQSIDSIAHDIQRIL